MLRDDFSERINRVIRGFALLDIPYHTEIKIPSIHFKTTVNQSAHRSWTTVTGRIRSMARVAYYRELSLDKRMLYVHNYLLATAWYKAQIFPMPEACTRQVNSAIAWYLWRGDIFRVPSSTFQRRKRQGRWKLLHVAAKSRTLLFFRLRAQSQGTGSLT